MMNRQDRIRAFSMRCEGMTWAQIGAALNYDSQTVAKDLRSVLDRQPRVPAILYPRLKGYVRENCQGSVGAFAGQLGVSPYRLRRVLVHGDPPSERLRGKLLAATGLPESEAFSTAE